MFLLGRQNDKQTSSITTVVFHLLNEGSDVSHRVQFFPRLFFLLLIPPSLDASPTGICARMHGVSVASALVSHRRYPTRFFPHMGRSQNALGSFLLPGVGLFLIDGSHRLADVEADIANARCVPLQSANK